MSAPSWGASIFHFIMLAAFIGLIWALIANRPHELLNPKKDKLK